MPSISTSTTSPSLIVGVHPSGALRQQNRLLRSDHGGRRLKKQLRDRRRLLLLKHGPGARHVRWVVDGGSQYLPRYYRRQQPRLGQRDCLISDLVISEELAVQRPQSAGLKQPVAVAA